jgi:cytochrome c oxidase cbb3-type subunit 4
MDINTLRIVVTLLSFAIFIAIMVWACSRRREADFAEAAHLPFVQD